MLGRFPLTESSFPVDGIGITYPHAYPQETGDMRKTIFWKIVKAQSIYGGIYKAPWWISTRLVHTQRHLSTNNRDLSTVVVSK
jgi:hypothetical protein